MVLNKADLSLAVSPESCFFSCQCFIPFSLDHTYLIHVWLTKTFRPLYCHVSPECPACRWKEDICVERIFLPWWLNGPFVRPTVLHSVTTSCPYLKRGRNEFQILDVVGDLSSILKFWHHSSTYDSPSWLEFHDVFSALFFFLILYSCCFQCRTDHPPYRSFLKACQCASYFWGMVLNLWRQFDAMFTGGATIHLYQYDNIEISYNTLVSTKLIYRYISSNGVKQH